MLQIMMKFAIIGFLFFNITCSVAKNDGAILFGGILPESKGTKINTNVENSKQLDIPKSNTDNNQDQPLVLHLQENPFNGDSANDHLKKGKSKDGSESNSSKKDLSLNASRKVLNNTNGNDSNKNAPLIPVHSNNEDVIQSGALLRGFYVFLGLSVLTMMYFVFRSFRLRHGGQPLSTVRKYGVTARRSDMEMRPLELDDDDDDTLFEIGNQSANIR